MTAVLEGTPAGHGEAEGGPALSGPPEPLYASPWGLLPFQAEIVIQCCVRPAALVVADTGLGKTHIDLATAALKFEDGEIDIHLLVCEQDKISEWVEDFQRYTKLSVVDYRGPLTRRRKIISSLTSDKPIKIGKSKADTVHRPQVLVGTYETFRNDMGKKVTETNRKGRPVVRLGPGVLTEVLVGRKILVGYDEMTKLGNRGSDTHKVHALFLEATGAQPLGLTATPIERNPENYYNLGRILCPDAVGTVESFAKDHVRSYNQWNEPDTFKNLTIEDTFEPWVTPLSVKMGAVLIRKRETDDDVRAQFPEKSEKFIHVDLDERHQQFYEVVRDTFADADEMEQRQIFTMMRQIAGHPLSLLGSEGKFAKVIVREVGEAGLAALGSAKLDVLSARLKPLVIGQGAQAVVFTFFGPTMIPLIRERLEADGMTVGVNYPAAGDKVRREHRAEFKEGHRRVYLTSDAGARGINLPQAMHVLEYESALTFSNRQQRINRVHRINSRDFGVERVYAQTLVARDTVEEGIADGVMRRNTWSDALLEDDDPGEHFVTAKDRKRLLAISRRRAA